MKHQVFFLVFIKLLMTPLLHGTSTQTQSYSKKLQFALQILEEIQFVGTEHLLTTSYKQEDLNAYIARNLVPQGLVIAIEPDDNLAEKATLDYRGIKNLHIVSMDASYFDFCKSLDIVLSIFPNDLLKMNKSINQFIQNITQSLKAGGKLYLCLDSNNTNKHALIVQKLMSLNEYLHVCYEQNDLKKFCLIRAQKK